MFAARFRLPSLREIGTRRTLATRRTPRAHLGPRNSIVRPEPIQPIRKPADTPEQQESANSQPQDAYNPNYDPADNTLLAPVHIPENPSAVLKENHPATKLLANSGLVVQRQLEMMNVMIGFEQANKYVIMDAQGNHVGYMAEQENGMANAMARQSFRTHRSFVTHVFDRHENEVLRVSQAIYIAPRHLECSYTDCSSSTGRSPGSTPESKFTILSMLQQVPTPLRPPCKT